MSVGVIQNIMVETVKKMSTKVDFLLFFNLNKVETVKKMSTEVDVLVLALIAELIL